MNSVLYTAFGPKDESVHQAFYIGGCSNASWKEHLLSRSQELEHLYGRCHWSVYFVNVDNFALIFKTVERDKHLELMHVLRQTLLNTCPDCTVGPVCSTVAPINDVDVRKMLQVTKDAHEQQQAEKLRNALNTHMSVVQSMGQPKKM